MVLSKFLQRTATVGEYPLTEAPETTMTTIARYAKISLHCPRTQFNFWLLFAHDDWCLKIDSWADNFVCKFAVPLVHSSARRYDEKRFRFSLIGGPLNFHPWKLISDFCYSLCLTFHYFYTYPDWIVNYRISKEKRFRKLFMQSFQ